MKPPVQTTRDRDRLDVKMTPMIDVVFLLLIFFVCTASTTKLEELLPTNLSATGSLETIEPIEPPPDDLGEVVVKVRHAQGEVVWEVNGELYRDPRKVRGVLQALARVKSDLPIILDVEGDIELTHAIDLYDWCRQAGFEVIQFAASLEA